MALIGFIVVGLIVGLLARALLPGRQRLGLLWTLLLGVAGSVVGGVIASLIGTGRVGDMDFLGFIVAVIASIALLALGERRGLTGGRW